MTAEAPLSEAQRLRYEHVLIGWQAYLRKQYPIIDSIQRGPEDFWQRVMSNTIPDQEAEHQIAEIEAMGGRHLFGSGFQACRDLMQLRKMDMLPRVEPLYSAGL